MWTGPEAIWTALFYILLFVGGPYYIYKRRKKAKQLKAEGKLPFGKTYLGCTLPVIIFLIIAIIFGVKMMGDMYDKAEKNSNKISFDKLMVFFNSSNEYQDLSNTQKKTTAVKLFLLHECRGGDETLKKLIQYEQNILYDACIIIQNNNIIDKFTENDEDPKSFHMQVLKTDFKGAVKLYDWYTTE